MNPSILLQPVRRLKILSTSARCLGQVIGLLLAAGLNGLAAPTIISEPKDQSVSIGDTVQFTVSVPAASTLTYQWRSNEVAIAGATAARLSLANVQTTFEAGYSVVVSDDTGSVTSRVARLTVDTTFSKITTGEVVTVQEQAVNFAWWDYDHDKYLDLYICNADANDGHCPDATYHNNGDGTFTKMFNTGMKANPAGLEETFGAAPGDYDNDGNLDLFAATIQFNNLFRNNGDGRFESMSSSQVGRLVADNSWSYAGAWGDYDNDGFVDLFVANWQGGDFLYRNDGTGRFTRMTTNDVGPIVAKRAESRCGAWADYDNDGYLDLYVSSGGTNFLFRNSHTGSFWRIADASLGSHAGFTGTWADYDNDGFFDLFVGRRTAGCALHRNLGGQTFTNVTSEAALTVKGADVWGGAWGDYDNDGCLDLFVLSYTGPNALFHNQGDGTFTNVNLAGLQKNGNERVAAAWGDYDNDGFLDLFVACGNAVPTRNLLYHNNGNSNAWLKLELVGQASNRSGIGARVRVQATIGDKTFWQMRQISGTGASCGGNGLVAHFGLGDATKADVVRIEWPSGIVQELSNVPAKQFLTITEQQADVTQAPSLAESRLVDGTVQLSLAGQTNFLYVIEASTNLVQWTKIGVRTNLTGSVEFGDCAATDYPQRFYRAVVP